MCFSESVSIIAGSGLLVGGAYAGVKAWTVNKRYLPVSLMPVFAGLQQLSEGFVWSGMTGADSQLVQASALIYIFFTWFMWPFWIPLSVFVLEPRDSRRKYIFLFFAAVGLGFGMMLYVPHLIRPEWVDVTVNRNSLAYEGTMLLDFLMPRSVTNALYLALIILPPLMSRYRHMFYFGLTLIGVTVVDFLFLRYAYISFFCLLAGLATVHLIYIISRNHCRHECPELFA